MAHNSTMDAPGRPRVIAAAVVFVVFAVVAGPVVGAIAGAITLVAAVWRPARWVLAFGGTAALAAAGAYTVVQQARYGYPPDFAWPVNVERAHQLGWLAVALLTATAQETATQP